MNTLLLILCFVGLQAAFVWARTAVFRIDGPTPRGVQVIEVSTVLCIALGITFIARRVGAHTVFDSLAWALAGASAALFSWAVRSVRHRQLSAAFCDDLPVELLRGGAFAFVRNHCCPVKRAQPRRFASTGAA